MVLELDSAPRLAERSERMNVAIAGMVPVAEFDAELEGCPGGAHELGLIQAEHVVELLDVGQRRLAHADDPDFVRFDENDAVRLARQAADYGRGSHPPGGAAAEDHDAELAVCLR